jgi:hypothetical protein
MWLFLHNHIDYILTNEVEYSKIQSSPLTPA